MRWLTGLLGRAVRRVRAHRGAAVAFFGFVVAAGTVVQISGVVRPAVTWLGGMPGRGVPGAVFLAMTMAWLPLMVIDMRRCTRETALRRHVEADLEARTRAERTAAEAVAAKRAKVVAVLANGGPRIVYQPIVDMGTTDVVGYEALSRFGGEGSPAEWFASAAEVGLGVDLELAAVRRALADLDRLPAATYLSVNVSPETLVDSRLATLLGAAPGDRIVLELTEHSAVTDYAPYCALMAEFRTLGVRLAVDDAGAGYSSLRHIVDLAPDVIKVDRSLVQGIDVDPARRSLFVALVTFAGDLGAVLVAEGVENADEARQLSTWGVRLAQGWHYGRPEPLAGAEPLRTAS
jgi:EAL domain-containing protein (putative c-di-GMP-specific phosphodiesterase class I)